LVGELIGQGTEGGRRIAALRYLVEENTERWEGRRDPGCGGRITVLRELVEENTERWEGRRDLGWDRRITVLKGQCHHKCIPSRSPGV
jgi:hypothetical protein